MEKIELGQIQEFTGITNPRHSKLLDVHRYSEHSAVSHLVQPIWSKCFDQPELADTGKGGVKPKASSLTQLQAILLDLYIAWANDPELSIAVEMSNTAWNTGSRYNKIGMSRQAPRIIQRLREFGFIDLAAASYAGPGVVTNRTTRIRAAELLRAKFREAKFGPQHILTHPDKECIIMRGSEKSERNIEYADTPETEKMRADLTAYNRLLQRTFIDVPDQESTLIERPIKTGYRAGQMTRVPICGFDNFVHRVFNRNDWRCGGRFYGGWWQGVGSEFRKRIHINDRPTVEVDFQALHIAILAAKHGTCLEEDPYTLEAGLVEGMDANQQRKLVKLLVLMSLNAKSKNAACSAFREASPAGSQAKSMTNKDLLGVLDALVERLPFLSEYLCADRGIRLMNTDSRIAARILRFFTKQKVPVLCVHDSFIIDHSKARPLKVGMTMAAVETIGMPVGQLANYRGLDEVKMETPELVREHVKLRYRPRCDAYKVRQRIFNERLAYLGYGEGGGTG